MIQPTAAIQPAVAIQMPLEKTSILFVDDDSSLLASLRRILHRFRSDWQMEFCFSAKEALRHLEQKHVDVVVSDIRMPEMDGTELMQAVAANHPSVIRFILSGQAEKETVLKLVGVTHQYFAKPCNPNKLFEAVSEIMTKRQQINGIDVANQLTGLASIPIAHPSFEQLQAELAVAEPNMNRIVTIIRGDIGLGLKVLQLVSTSFFGTPQPGCNLSLACRTLGIDLIRSVLLAKKPTQPIALQQQEVSETAELYRQLAHYWQALQHSPDTTTKLAENAVAVFKYLTSLWGVDNSSVSQRL